ncbi:MAG: CHAD domain-containing protein [Anaerolineae bacterium]
MITRENTLTERERHILKALAADPDAATASRAQVLLHWADGDTREQIAQATGLRPAQALQITRAFSQKRLEIFAPPSIERASRGLAGATTVDDLLQENHVNMGHARFVANLALQILDATQSVHQLAPEWRRVLETGALLHNLASPHHDERRHRAGRNLILAHDIEGFSAPERDILACLVLFHTKKVQASRDPIFVGLDPQAQQVTLALAAMLRIADGMDFSQSETTAITSIEVDSLVLATLDGPHADIDAARANKKADLWRQVLTPPFSARLPNGALPTAPRLKRPKVSLGVKSHEPITRAGRKIVAGQFVRLRVLEDEVRGGHNPDAVHDMRVAARRMRSAFRLLAGFYPTKETKKIRHTLPTLSGYLGQVRDLDVMIAHLHTHISTLPTEQQRLVDPLLADWQARRARAHGVLVEFLEDKKYEDWTARLEGFVEGKDTSGTPRVTDVAPALIWKQYGKVHAFEPVIQQADLATLHRLRIQCKRLRYTIEFFSEMMGPETSALLEPLIAMQTYLGELHDVDTAARLTSEFIAETTKQGLQNTNLEGVMAYLSALHARTAEMQAGVPERWHVLAKPSYRQALGQAVANL